MCEKPKNSRNIDPCLKDFIHLINQFSSYRTILSCCGHGKFKPSILVYNKDTKKVFDVFSRKTLSLGIRKPKRYYKRDPEGYYYIPELR